MSVFALSPRECGNRLLSLLPDDDLAALSAHLEMVDLDLKQVLGEREHAISHVYFPCSAVLSVLAQMLEGQAVEVGTIGNEGFYGIDVLLGGAQANATETTLCQVSGKALRLPTAAFVRVLDGSMSLRDVTQRYMLAYMSLLSQSVACNRLHTTEARFARWLLMTHDRVTEDTFHITQEFLANMLGVQRPSVSLVAGAFQQAGMIRYNRGQMTILNRQALEESSCECYGIVQQQFERRIGPFRKGCGDRR
ncbi:Crp/Fnr family transcriptional regulator [Noviherbaspirillum sp.]|uniref:Crp/Fnr family transcriptional regulator n=1 Tax=Noviherbaspirillum sp. TaxID=1926288 RepID=UPI002D4E46AC|nr:Crp/Fnr family transcriptional regulator [Noviherbaspirillum sp.]HZW20305.1 Crp/Fnr family transcriptional regulator [Noviherbaspirillum sp.]